MPVILGAIVLAVLIALTAGAGFYMAQEPVYEAQPSQSVRVGDPGHNLVGPHWSGDPTVDDAQRKARESVKVETKDAG